MQEYKNPAAQKLALVAHIVENKLPWEWRRRDDQPWNPNAGNLDILRVLANGDCIQIRNAGEPKAPPGMQWHNPQNIPASRVGWESGWRLLTDEEVDDKYHSKVGAEYLGRINDKWAPELDDLGWRWNDASTIRVPIDLPLNNGRSIWKWYPDIREFIQGPPTVQVALEWVDILPLTLFRRKGTNGWVTVGCCSENHVVLNGYTSPVQYADLKADWEMQLAGTTVWLPCSRVPV